MSYDIYLKDPVTNEAIEINEPHFMRGGTYQIGGSKELWLNITYNYSHYYYEATDGDPRFAHKEERNGEFENEYGIRGIYGKTGLESIPMLEDMILRITERYQVDGEWISTKRTVSKYYDEDGKEVQFDVVLHNALHDTGKKFERVEEEIIVNEGPNNDYWEPTAANAIRPLKQLIVFAQMRPDGIWDGD